MVNRNIHFFGVIRDKRSDFSHHASRTDLIAPSPRTCSMVDASNPTDSESARLSPKAAIIVPMSEFTTSLARVPYPTVELKK